MHANPQGWGDSSEGEGGCQFVDTSCLVCLSIICLRKPFSLATAVLFFQLIKSPDSV